METAGTHKPLRTAVVGRGLGAVHAAAFAASPLAELTAVCDPDEHRIAENSRRFPGSRGYQDLESMLAAEDLDLVSICTPDWMHLQMGRIALRAGCEVILTKPLANSVAEASS